MIRVRTWSCRLEGSKESIWLLSVCYYMFLLAILIIKRIIHTFKSQQHFYVMMRFSRKLSQTHPALVYNKACVNVAKQCLHFEVSLAREEGEGLFHLFKWQQLT